MTGTQARELRGAKAIGGSMGTIGALQDAASDVASTTESGKAPPADG